MIPIRSCSKSSSWFNGTNRYYCATHNHEMTDGQYQCPHGDLENTIASQANIHILRLTQRLEILESHFNDHLKTFAANLEKLHERDPDPTR